MNIPANKDYRDQSELTLYQDDIEALTLKQHPMQEWFIKSHPELSKDDCFSFPLPYLRAVDKAYMNFEKKGAFGRGFATASYEVQMDDPWFYCHFLGDPVMPGSQGQDAIFQLAGVWSTIRGEIIGRPRALAGQFDFFGQILPYSKTIFYRIDIKRFLKKKRILFFTGSIAVDTIDNVIYRFEECKIGFFTKEELSIQQRSHEYYQPDWKRVAAQQLHHIELSKQYYEQSR
ncbi:MAG: hypothetical protein AAF798_01335 [Bacteroidota bacterium]